MARRNVKHCEMVVATEAETGHWGECLTANEAILSSIGGAIFHKEVIKMAGQ